MTISYPLTPPTSPKPSSIQWIEYNIVGVSQSRYTGQAQIQDWSSAYWGIEVTIDELYRSEAQPWMAFLSALRGERGTFYFGDELFSDPLGAAGGSPKVNGGSQTGFTLITDGWASGQLVLKAGDFFQIGTSLYRTLLDVTADGSGNATIDIFPNARGHADNSSLITANPVGVFRLTESDVRTQFGNRNQLFPIAFTAVEAR